MEHSLAPTQAVAASWNDNIYITFINLIIIISVNPIMEISLFEN